MKDDMITSAGGAPPRTDAAASDAAEVLTIHEAWFASAMGLDVERMRPNYVSGPHMRMYNTDGHTYIGVEELVRSWEAWHGTMDVHACEGVSEPVEVAGDIAWLVVDQVEMRCRSRAVAAFSLDGERDVARQALRPLVTHSFAAGATAQTDAAGLSEEPEQLLGFTSKIEVAGRDIVPDLTHVAAAHQASHHRR